MARILVVDDKEVVRDGVGLTLARSGHAVCVRLQMGLPLWSNWTSEKSTWWLLICPCLEWMGWSCCTPSESETSTCRSS